MRTFFGFLVVLLCAIGALADSYGAGQHAGFFSWEPSPNSGTWTPRIPGLPYYNNGTVLHPFRDPQYMYSTSFSDANLSITCNPSCSVGSRVSIDLTMSNFTLTRRRPYSYPDLNAFVGTLNLITRPIVLNSSSGIALARFSLTGDLLGCTDTSCGTTLFSLSVNTQAFARFNYSFTNGQLSISSVSFILPEPSNLTLLGTGLLFALGKMRQRRAKKLNLSPAS